jgi:dTMP kinase
VSRGRFITFEGGEGAGKSTQAKLLAERLGRAGVEVTLTREPGGTPGAEAIRELVLTGDVDRWSPMSETLLMYAARRDHIERVIIPARDRGAWVICDRFADSTRAYQGAGGEVRAGFLAALEDFVLEVVRPDLTLVLDLSPEIGLGRVAGRAHATTRFEAKDAGFHVRLRNAFLDIAKAEPERCVVIDAERPADEVAEQIRAAVEARFGLVAAND